MARGADPTIEALGKIWDLRAFQVSGYAMPGTAIPGPFSGALAGILTGISGLIDPFAAFSDRSDFGWPSAGFVRDGYAVGGDFWRAIGRSTVDENGVEQPQPAGPHAIGA